MTQGTIDAEFAKICHEMILANEIPNPDMLDTYVKQYPQYSVELTDFAVALALDVLAPLYEEVDDAPERATPAVSRTMSHFQNALFDAQQKGDVRRLETKQVLAHMQNAANPIAALSKAGFKGFACRLDVNSVLAAKLRDRQIASDTMPAAFITMVAQCIPEDIDIVAAHLMAAPDQTLRARQFHKADGKPGNSEQESFEDAVKNSGLTEDQKRKLLAY